MKALWRVVAFDLSRFLFVPAGMAAVTCCVAAGFGEVAWAIIFAGLAGGAVGLAWLLALLKSPASAGDENWQELSSVAVVWGAISLIGAVPFWLGAEHMVDSQAAIFSSPLNAWFESMSGFTSTGLSMSSDASALPRSIQWWRSFAEWIGGVGVVVLALTVIDKSERARSLYGGEGRSATLGEDFSGTAKRIWKIYVGLTLGCLLGYLLTEVPWWEAVNHAMTTPSTGGFTIRSDSFASYSLATQTVAIVFMLLGAVSFQTYYLLGTRRSLGPAWRNSALRTYVALLLLCLSVLLGVNALGGYSHDAAELVFQVVSAAATAGLSSADLSVWPAPLLLVLMALMFVGGCAGSTTGGLKANRLMWLVKGARARVLSAWTKEESKVSIEVDGESQQTQEANQRIRSAATLLALYLLAAFIGAFIWSLTVDAPLEASVFAVISALGGVGLSAGGVSASLDPVPKTTIIMLMWMGRLEMVAVLVLIIAPFRVVGPKTPHISKSSRRR